MFAEAILLKSKKNKKKNKKKNGENNIKSKDESSE